MHTPIHIKNTEVDPSAMIYLLTQIKSQVIKWGEQNDDTYMCWIISPMWWNQQTGIYQKELQAIEDHIRYFLGNHVDFYSYVRVLYNTRNFYTVNRRAYELRIQFLNELIQLYYKEEN